MIDEKLTWKCHISKVCKQISKNIGVMSKLRCKLSNNIMLTLYNTLVLPHLLYCNIIWGCSAKTNLEGILKLQKEQCD